MKSLSWRIGNVEIVQILEMEENKIFSSFIPNATPENIKKIDWLKPYFASDDGVLKANVQSFLIKSGGKNILIDTCNGNGKDRSNVPEWSNLNTNYPKKFEENDIDVRKIDMVACTHLHFDHVGWNTKLENGKWVPTFPNARYIFSKSEYNYWVSKPEKEMIDDLNGIQDSVKPIVDLGLVEFVEDDYEIDKCVRFVPSPGHTPHHVSLMIESMGEKALISGDFVHHPCQIVNQTWNSGADTFPEQTIDTRKKLLNEIKDSGILLIGSHFSYPVAGYVRSIKNSLIFEPYFVREVQLEEKK